VEPRRFVRGVQESFALSEQSFSNQCWKQSRGVADWVIVIDVDEHLFHPFGRSYLSHCSAVGVTVIPALGFQMISEDEPPPDAYLCMDYPIGAPWEPLMKIGIFNPNVIAETNFSLGRHRSDPTGEVCFPAADELLLFHFKYMGFERTHRRHLQLRTGLGARDIHEGWGHKYLWTAEELRKDWDGNARRAIDTTSLRSNPATCYPIRPWWQKHRE
jgi:hypothetical protein